MKKNVIFIHLESLNQTIFSKKQWFPCLNKVYQHSLSLNNFISTATSSIMALSDLLHGDDSVMEHNRALEVGVTVNRHTPPLFDSLARQGYRTLGVGYPKNWASVDNVWSENQPFHWHNTASEMLDHAESIMAGDAPFALYVWNLCSHLCYQDNIKASGANSFERWQKGYQSMDATVGLIFGLLAKKKQLENTVVIGFGDHGDDFWNHGFNGGFAHGIEPWTSLVHTPAFIFSPGLKAQNIDHLVSLTDLKNTAEQLIGVAEPSGQQAQTTFALAGKRAFCFSRNLFAAQNSSETLKKGYSITSQTFHLVRTDDRYQMFAWQADGGNQFDLLPLIAGPQGSGIDFRVLANDRTLKPHPHIRHFLPDESAAVIGSHFADMKARLETYIQAKRQQSGREDSADVSRV